LKVKKSLKSLLLNYYVKTGKVLTFSQVQDILANAGFGYRIEKGRKKLYARKRIHEHYRSIKRRLPLLKQDRDFALELLEFTHKAVIEGRARQGMLRKVFSAVRDKLTKDDEKHWGKIVYPSSKEKQEERIEL